MFTELKFDDANNVALFGVSDFEVNDRTISLWLTDNDNIPRGGRHFDVEADLLRVIDTSHYQFHEAVETIADLAIDSETDLVVNHSPAHPKISQGAAHLQEDPDFGSSIRLIGFIPDEMESLLDFENNTLQR